MNKFIFWDIAIDRKSCLEKDVELKTKNLKDGDRKFLSGKGQIVDEKFEISSGHIMFDAECKRKDYPLLKAEVINLIKANLMIYGDKFISNIPFAEKQMQKGLKEKFSCTRCEFISLEGTKSIDGKIEVSTVNGKEILELVSINEEKFNYLIDNKTNTI